MPERGRDTDDLVLTTIGLPKSVWMAAKIVALHRRVTFRSLVIEGLAHVSASQNRERRPGTEPGTTQERRSAMPGHPKSDRDRSTA